MRSLASTTTTRSATTVALPVDPERSTGIAHVLHRVLDVALGIAAFVALVVFVGIGLLPRTGWYRVETVLSGSMRPDFAPGDMIVVTPESTNDIRVGQVITYAIPVGDHHVETHRVAKILQRGPRP